MFGIILTALSAAFILVRIIKGPWMRNPQYLAAATIGSVALSLIFITAAPEMESDIIAGTLAGIIGAWAGIAAFDFVIKQ